MIVIIGDKSDEGLLMDLVESKLNALCNDEKIVRLRQVESKDVYSASYILERIAYYLPRGTIFLSIVDAFNESARIPIVLETKDEKIFVGFDNGMFTAVIKSYGIHQIRRIKSPERFSLSFFRSSLNILVSTVSDLTMGKKISEVGELYMTYYSLKYHKVVLFPDKIEGEVAFFDGQNVETNIPFSLLKKLNVESGDEIRVKGKIVLVSEDERDRENKSLILREGAAGYAEIISQFSAADILKVQLGEKLTLEVLK